MSERDFTYLTNSISSELIPLIIEDCHCSRLEAIDKLYQSRTYKNLQNPDTGLYYQSTLYVFELLKEEFSLSEMRGILHDDGQTLEQTKMAYMEEKYGSPEPIALL